MSLSQAKYPPASRNDRTRRSRLKDDDASHHQNMVDKTEGERERERVRDSTLNSSHNDESHRSKSKWRDMHQGDTCLVKPREIPALPMGQGRRGERTVDACQVDMQSIERSNGSVSSVRRGKAAARGRQGIDLIERKEMEKNGRQEPSVCQSKNDNISHHEKTVWPQTKGTVNKAVQKQMPDGILHMSGNDETRCLKSKKKDMRQGDACLAESQNVSASPVRRGREGERPAKRTE
jgi:hypothetical protein